MAALRIIRLAFVALIAWAAAAMPAGAQTKKDMLGVPGPIMFQGVRFDLAWTSRPSPEYFKQEYLPAGENAGSYHQMFIVEANTSLTPEAAAADKINMLKGRKGSDPVVNYAAVRNDKTGEIILDFVLSDPNNGNIIVEWDAYRYAPLGKAGGVAFYAISRRAYGDDDARMMLRGLKQDRPPAINALAAFDAPKLTPAK